MSRLLLFAAAALGAFSAVEAHSQSGSSGRTVDEVIVTAAPYAVTLDTATTSVDVLKREALDQAPSGGLGDVLSGMAGVRSSAFGPGASRPVIRGLSGPRVLVLSNGLGQVDASALSPDHAVATDPQEAERIEVLRGPSALAYGGSAIGGVVNIIDDRIPRVRQEGPSGRLHASLSSVDDGWMGGAALKAGHRALVVSLDALRRDSQDYAVPTFPESRGSIAAEGGLFPGHIRSNVANSFAELSAYGGGLSYVGDAGYIGGSVKRTESRYGAPGHAHEAAGAEEVVTLDLAQTRYDLRGEYRRAVGPFDSFRFAAGYADYTHTELENGAPATRFLSDGWEARLEMVQPDRKGWKGAVGVQGLQRDFRALGDEAFVPPTVTREWGVFALQRYDGEGWGVEGGLRLETKSLDSTVGSRDFIGLSASAGVFLRPAQGWFLSLSGSRTERAPSQEELFADGPHPATQSFEAGDPTLRSEVARSADLTVHYRDDRLDVDAHVFAARYDGFIDLRPTGGVAADSGLPIYRFQQTDAAFHGFEIDGSLRVWEAGDSRIRLEATADWVRGRTDLGPPARIPPWSATGRAVIEHGIWTGTLEARRVGRQDRVAAFELPTTGYTLLNAMLSVTPLTDQNLRVFVEGRNLGDVEAREHASFLKDLAPLPGRNVRLGLGYRF